MAGRKLQVDIVVDDHGAVRRLKDVAGAERKVGTEAKGAGRHVGALGSFLKTAGATMAGFVGAAVIMRGLGAAFRFTKEAAFGMNATLETTTLQFTTLMGDAQRAEEHVASLFEFAKRTPFETGPIIEASRMMQTFGGEALNTKENLTILGDAAAATGAPINELGFWVGRMFAALKGGQPFGEAAQRLQELAVLTPEARQQMEALQKAGASATDIFDSFKGSLETFTGGMGKMASTWQGVTSTFKDTVVILIAQAFQPLFETARDALGMINRAMGMEGFEGTMVRVREAVAAHIPPATTILTNFLNVVGGFTRAADMVQTFWTMLILGANRGGEAMGNLGILILETTQRLINLASALDPVGTKLGLYDAMLRQTIRPLQALRDATEELRGRQIAAFEAFEQFGVGVSVFRVKMDTLKNQILDAASAEVTLERETSRTTASIMNQAANAANLASILGSLTNLGAPPAPPRGGRGATSPAAAAASGFAAPAAPSGFQFSSPSPSFGAFGRPQFRFDPSRRDRSGRLQSLVAQQASFRQRFGFLNMTVNAQGAMFEDDRSLDRLADKVSKRIMERLPGSSTVTG